MRPRSILISHLLALLGVLTPIWLAASEARSGHTSAHDGSDINFEVHGTGPRYLLFGFNLQLHSPQLQEFVAGLGQDYKLIVLDYPGEPKMYTLTPAAVVRDYLAVADAAGAETFAFYGYSWGAACGLQLALRTDRVKALIAGGFPMIGGPYLPLRNTLRKRIFENAALPDGQRGSWAEFRQFLTFYEALQSFDDRLIQKRLTMPRLNFVGTDDRVTFFGGDTVEFYKLFNENKREIEAAGWDVMAVQGENHLTALSPRVSVPLIRQWLKQKWP